jgi:hypothetical protein
MIMTIRRSAALLTVLAWAATTTACLIVLDDPNAGPYGTRREFHRLAPFAPGSILALRNLDGDVEIRGWDRNEIEITVESDDPGQGRGGWSVLRGTGRPRFEVEEAAGRLAVRTRWEGSDRAVYAVHYFIKVPRSITLEEAATQRGNILIADLYGQAKVSVLDGDLTVENYSGGLDATVARGRVRAEILDLRRDDAVRLTVRTGDVSLSLEPAASAHVDAEAFGGVSGDWVAPAAGRKADLKLGAGEATVVLRAPSGKIEIRKIQ